MAAAEHILLLTHVHKLLIPRLKDPIYSCAQPEGSVDVFPPQPVWVSCRDWLSAGGQAVVGGKQAALPSLYTQRAENAHGTGGRRCSKRHLPSTVASRAIDAGKVLGRAGVGSRA